MKTPLVDLHEDISLYIIRNFNDRYDFNEDLDNRYGDIPKYKAANIRLIFAYIFPGLQSHIIYNRNVYDYHNYIYNSFTLGTLIVWEHLKIYYGLSNHFNIKIIETFREIKEIFENKKWMLGFILHIEGADPIIEIDDIHMIYRLGVRSIGLTWNKSNRYGAACTAIKDYGLTDAGYELIKVANKIGMIIDLAHASKNTTMDAIKASSKPVVISHTNLRWHVDHPRNIDEDIINMLKMRDGVFGYSFIDTLIKKGERPTINDVIEQLIEIVDKFGSCVISIGTDYFGFLKSKPPIGLENVKTIIRLLAGLEENGLSKDEIKDIAYRNVLRVLEKNLK